MDKEAILEKHTFQIDYANGYYGCQMNESRVSKKGQKARVLTHFSLGSSRIRASSSFGLING